GILSNILFVPTGALLSATTAEQKKTIPSIAHLIDLVSPMCS
ncbi:MAG: stage V sporulation protein AD, partial [Ruminococcus sp.]|nr:stage V sporulation protein AD [Ruminococcus sp.]